LKFSMNLKLSEIYISKIANFFAKYSFIATEYLFGSYAKGT